MVSVLFDHNMPPRIARALHELVHPDGHEAFALRDKFRVDVSDVEYFNRLERGARWIIISKDLKNSRKKAERAAILNNKLVAFYLSPSLQRKLVNEQAAAVLWHWDKMLLQRNLLERGLLQVPENKSKFKQL